MISLEPSWQPIHTEIEIPGSKSYTNRALIMAAMVKDPVTIHNPLFSDDTAAMIDCLTRLGIRVKVSKSKIEVIGNIWDVKNGNYILNAKISGTTIRFILALSCIVPGIKILEGELGLLKRPIKELVEGLRQLGAKIEYLEKEGFPPLKVLSSSLSSGNSKLNGDISSQYFSAILMIAPVVGDISIEVIGNQISKPYIDMTIDSMKFFGINVVNNNYKSYQIKEKQNYKLNEYTVEGDFSSAGYFFAIAALTKSQITLSNLNIHSKQADKKFLDILRKMGNEIKEIPTGIIIKGKGIDAVDVDMEDCPDQIQTLAVLAAFAEGVTHITGVRSLRVKETERVKALQTELSKMGIKTESTEDSLTIYGGNPKPATIDTYGDHRMAMSFAVAGSKISGMKINNPEVVSKTFPDFWEKLKAIGVKIL